MASASSARVGAVERTRSSRGRRRIGRSPVNWRLDRDLDSAKPSYFGRRTLGNAFTKVRRLTSSIAAILPAPEARLCGHHRASVFAERHVQPTPGRWGDVEARETVPAARCRLQRLVRPGKPECPPMSNRLCPKEGQAEFHYREAA